MISHARLWLAAAIAGLAAMTGCSREAPEEQPPQTFEQDPELLPQELHNGALAAASPEELRRAINRWGADAVVASLWGGWDADAGWDRLIERMSAGDEDWLRLTPLIQPGSDGHVSETLHLALSNALQNNAPAVLRLIASGDAHVSVCAMNAIEPTEAEIAQFYRAAIPAAEAVTAPELQAAKAECLASLRRSLPAAND